MRLTLRTLLAYRDGVLNESDRNVLSNKLRESVTARGISSRIDESLKNPRLAPIPVDARDPWFDANQIAEYLDDTTPTELVAEVERRCLENNALLSEVGSCHSILSRALNELVDVPEDLKTRIKLLPREPQLGRTELRIERSGDPHSLAVSNATDANDSSQSVSLPTNSHAEQNPTGDNSNHPNPVKSMSNGGSDVDKSDGAGNHPEKNLEIYGSSPSNYTTNNPLLAPHGDTSAHQVVNKSASASGPAGSVGTDGPTGRSVKHPVAKGIELRPEPRGRGIELDDGLGSQVPEYLRSSDRGQLKPILGVACLLVGIVVTGTLALGSLETVGKLLAPVHVAKADSSKDPNSSSIAKIEPQEKTRKDIAANTVSNPSNTNGESAKTVSNSEQIDGSTETVAAKPAANADGTINSDGAADVRDALAIDSPSALNPDEASIKPEASNDHSLGLAAASDGPGISWLLTNEASAQNLVFVSRNEPSGDSTPETLVNKRWALAKPNVKIGNSTWLFPFVYRTEVQVFNGLKAIVCGETELRSGDFQVWKPFSVNTAGTPATNKVVVEEDQSAQEASANDTLDAASVQSDFAMPYGRIMLFPSTEIASVKILLPVGIVEITFDAIDSSCAIETGTRVKQWDWMPGENSPEKLNPSSLQLEPFVDIIGIQGEMSCRLVGVLDGNSSDLVGEKAEKFEVGDVVRFTNTSIVKDALLNTPSWLKANTERAIDNLAAKDIQKSLRSSLEVESELHAVLRDLAEDRKPETASMANRILVQFGDFDRLAGPDGLLMKRSNYAHSSIWINKLPDLLYSSERVVAFETSMRNQLKEQFLIFCRLLFPMTNNQLVEGGDELLVNELSSSELPNRILAIGQLVEITKANPGYHPERNSGDSLAAWKKLQSDGAIRRSENRE